MLYHVDSLHPDRLLCSACGVTVARLPDDAAPPEPAELGDLTAEQVGHAWPERAAPVAWHDAMCPASAAVVK